MEVYCRCDAFLEVASTSLAPLLTTPTRLYPGRCCLELVPSWSQAQQLQGEDFSVITGAGNSSPRFGCQ